MCAIVDGETWGTQHHRTRSQEEEEEEEGGGGVGVWMPDHSITFLLHFYSGIGKESQKKKDCKREEIKLSWVNYQLKRELVGGYDHEMNRGAAVGGGARSGKKAIC